MSFQESRGGALPILLPPISIQPTDNRIFQPMTVLKRFPGAMLLTTKASLEAFVQTAGIMVPGGLIWKIGTLRASGMKPWLMEGGK